MVRLNSIIVLLLSLSVPALSGEVCDLVIEGCPSLFAGTTIDIPAKAVAVSPRVPVCAKEILKNINAAPRKISILFLIDESSSMQTTDSNGARYTVPVKLLENISAIAPDAEVGIVPFEARLQFDDRDDSYVQRAFPAMPYHEHDSYVPLTALNRSFPDGKTGLDTVKNFLKMQVTHRAPTASKGAYDEEKLMHGTLRFLGLGGTNITLAFEAAKVAMKASSALPEDRYIIFLSDGSATYSDNNAMFDFVQGKEVPTTFSIYFTGATPGGPVHPHIVEMTQNIRVNGYSSGNPSSAYWSVNDPATELQRLLEGQVLGKILVLRPAGKSAVADIGGGRFSTMVYDSGHFIFPKRMPLAAESTDLDFSFNFTYADTSKVPPVAVDTTTAIGFNVRRTQTATLMPGFSLICREQMQLGLYYGGQPIYSVVPEQNTLQIRLTPPAGTAPCTGCTVRVTPQAGPEREVVALSPATEFSAGTFGRTVAGPLPGDGVLQHASPDSIVLFYQNPEIPLDAVRRAYPFRLVPVPAPAVPTLELYHAGARLDAVRQDQTDLEIRVVFDPTDHCNPCKVEVRPSGGTDREGLLLGQGATQRTIGFGRELSALARPGDGRLQHGTADSLILIFTHPERPDIVLRKSYPFLQQPQIAIHRLAVSVENQVARKAPGGPSKSNPWVVDAPPGMLGIEGDPNCCRYTQGPLPATDSLGGIGIHIEAPGPFRAHLKVFSNLGHFVAKLAVGVTSAQFASLPPGSKDGTRRLLLFWDGRSGNGTSVGNGAYILQSQVSLMPSATQLPETWKDSRVVGFLR